MPLFSKTDEQKEAQKAEKAERTRIEQEQRAARAAEAQARAAAEAQRIAALEKWEYQTLRIPHPLRQAGKLNRSDLEKALAQAGAEGWEAFSFFPNIDLYAETDGALVLCKRPAAKKPPPQP